MEKEFSTSLNFPSQPPAAWFNKYQAGLRAHE